MAAFPDNSQYVPDPYLSPTQRDLLLAALSSNKPNTTNGTPSYNETTPNTVRPQLNQRHSSQSRGSTSGENDMSQYDASPLQNDLSTQSFDNLPLDENSFIDYDFDLGFADDSVDGINGQMIGNIPGPSSEGESDLHEKRKSVDEEDEDENENGAKRREGDEKGPRKPGRKPLTSEPTSKRKAQNRAAQRAFRERKEKHLKDLEVKVDDLEKASESANHENGLLRAQVDRLQTELKEYRQRLSVNGGLSRSPPMKQTNGNGANRLVDDSNNFTFAFPRFGNGAGGPSVSGRMAGSNESAKKQPSPATSNVKSQSFPGPAARSNGPSSGGNDVSGLNFGAGPNFNGNVDGLEDLFSPSILGSVTKSPESDYVNRGQNVQDSNQSSRTESDSSSGQGNTPQSQPDGSHTSMTSPSSSVSHHGPTSSCETSPEPSHQSPYTYNKQYESKTNGTNGHTPDCGCASLPPQAPGPQADFCKNLAQACGDPSNPIPPALSMPNDGSTSFAKTPGSEINGIDWMAQQNGGQFDPVLFGEYRESQDALASADFGTFFNEAFPLPDLGSPSFADNNVAEPTPKKDFLQEMDAKVNGDDEEEVVPGEDMSKMMNCNKIWDRLQNDDSFKNGDIDVDGLCSELRKKARCSETGVVVNHNDLEGVLAGYPGKQGQ